MMPATKNAAVTQFAPVIRKSRAAASEFTPPTTSTSHYLRNGCKWTASEDKMLLDKFNTLKDYKMICVELHRSIDALQARMVKIHIYPKIKFIFYEHDVFNKEYFNRFYHGVVDDYSRQYNIHKDNFMLYLKYADKNINPKNLDQTVHTQPKDSKVLNSVYNKTSQKKKKYDIDRDMYESEYTDSNDSSDGSNNSDDSDDSDYTYDDSDDKSHESDDGSEDSDIDISYINDIRRKLKKTKNLYEINRKLDVISAKLDKLLKK